MSGRPFDVAVIGAGTAGAAAAWHCARAGLGVVVLDRLPSIEAGARWLNGVPAAAFDEAGIPRPAAPESAGEPHPMHLVAGWGPQRLVVEHQVLEVDMRHLVSRLQGLAEEAGAELRGGVAVRGWEDRSEGVLATSAGSLSARWVIDASGLRSVGLMPRPQVPREHICSAAQAVHEVTDRQAAEAWFREQGTGFGPTACFTSVAGGFSVVNVRSDGEEIALLTGSIPALGQPGGQALLDGFVREHPWIGSRRFGGARAIPLRRPFDRLADDRVALLGDAASQVFSAHGSGIAAGLVAAKMLAEELVGAGGPIGYADRWQRTHGGRFAAFDLFRRFSQRMTVDDVAAMIGSGLMDPASTRATLEQGFPPLGPSVIATKILGLVRAPSRARQLLPVLAKMERVRRLYARFPGVDSPGLPRWSGRVAGLFGEDPDVG